MTASGKQGVFETTLMELESRIRDGIWRPGDRLPTLQNLAQEMQVGVSTLREVLRILENRNVIAIEQGRGMFVRTDLFTTQSLAPEIVTLSLKDFFEARQLMEPNLAYLAAQRAFMDEIEQIDLAARKMSALVEQHQNFAEADIEFHHLIAKAAHNDMLFQMFQMMEQAFSHGRHFTNIIPGMIDKAVHYHLIIAEALCDRNADQAKSLMQSHVDDMMSYVLGQAQLER